MKKQWNAPEINELLVTMTQAGDDDSGQVDDTIWFRGHKYVSYNNQKS